MGLTLGLTLRLTLGLTLELHRVSMLGLTRSSLLGFSLERHAAIPAKGGAFPVFPATRRTHIPLWQFPAAAGTEFDVIPYRAATCRTSSHDISSS